MHKWKEKLFYDKLLKLFKNIDELNAFKKIQKRGIKISSTQSLMGLIMKHTKGRPMPKSTAKEKVLSSLG